MRLKIPQDFSRLEIFHFSLVKALLRKQYTNQNQKTPSGHYEYSVEGLRQPVEPI